MEVPGKLAICDLCKAQNKSTKADGFCVDCDEYLCQACFTMHSLSKPCRNHVLSSTDEGKAKQVHKKVKSQNCKLHQEETVKYYCRSHDVIACVDCVVIDHRQCKVEFIRDISKNVCESSDFKDLLSKIQQLEADNKAYDKLRTHKQTENNTLLDKAASEIRKFRKEHTDYLDNAEKEILEEATQLTKENEKKMSTLEEKILSVMKKMSEIKNKLDPKSSQDEALFIRLIECKPDVKEIEQTLSDVKLITDINCFTFVRDESLEDLLKSRPKIGSLKTHQQPQAGKNPRAHGFFVETRVECPDPLASLTGVSGQTGPLPKRPDPTRPRPKRHTLYKNKGSQEKKIKLEGTLDVSTQPKTLSEELSSPNPASSEQGPTMSTTSVVTSLSSSGAITNSASNVLDIKPDTKSEIKAKVKTEPDLSEVKQEAMSADSSAETTPKTESTDGTEDVKPCPMDVNQSGYTPVQSTSPPKPKARKILKPDELRQALMSTLEKLYRQDPESLPFRQPVDPVALQIPDYYEIVRKPMDLSTIKTKLDTGQYKDPWEYVDDVWLMFDNAWVYNKKSSRVYKYCTKLSEVFEQEINSVMQSLGYCCGINQSFSPQVFCCYGKQLCTIPWGAVYYNYENKSSALLSDKYTYCEKCFLEIQGEEVELMDDPSQPSVNVPKDQFKKTKNDVLEMEPFVDCDECGRKLHKICVLHFEPIWTNGFTCENCLKSKGMKRKENKYCAKRLPGSKLGNYLESRINTFLKKKVAGAGEVSIKVLSSSDKMVKVQPVMKTKFVDNGEFPEQFPYKAKSIFVFEEIDGTDVCFFGMHVQEYGSECSHPNARRVYISYLDSVHLFQPQQLRTAVYHEILIGYLEYVKSLGYVWAHIWACPPSKGDDYIFHCHPPEQKIPKPKRLQESYKKMLNEALIERIVIDYKDIYKDAIENNITKVTDLPYFEGDFWPNVLEDIIREQEEEEKKKREEEEAAAAAEAEGSGGADDNEKPSVVETQGKKKGKSQKKSKCKSKNTNRKANSKKLNIPHGENDLTAKLYSTMQKHKEVFFVIRLHTHQAAANLPPIHDPDPHMSCELMDGRDALLTLARNKHYEFSSLRRAKFSSIALLYELHKGKESFVYTCNNCEAQVETRWHCSVCQDFDLCNSCCQKGGHGHKLDRIGFDLDDGSSSGDKQDPLENRRQSIQRCIQALVHACGCRDANCRMTSCHKMKRVVAHTKVCRKKTNSGCPICKQLIELCCYHAKHCNEQKCQVPFCLQIKHKLRQQQLQHRLQQAQLMRRRMATMQ